jgi:hypothetical protein
MAGADRSIWLRVANGVEILSGQGRKVWNEPAAVRNAVRELLSVVPVTHVQIDISALRGRSDPPAQWRALLARANDWDDLLRELTAATSDAVRGRAAWGIGLPGPTEVAESFGDVSERGILKAGLQLASFLQGFREAGIGFVALDLTGAAVPAKTVAPIFRNAELYGWERAAVLHDDSQNAYGASISLVAQSGLSAGFWNGEQSFTPGSGTNIVFGEIPAGIEPAAIVAAGRSLKAWLA